MSVKQRLPTNNVTPPFTTKTVNTKGTFVPPVGAGNKSQHHQQQPHAGQKRKIFNTEHTGIPTGMKVGILSSEPVAQKAPKKDILTIGEKKNTKSFEAPSTIVTATLPKKPAQIPVPAYTIPGMNTPDLSIAGREEKKEHNKSKETLGYKNQIEHLQRKQQQQSPAGLKREPVPTKTGVLPSQAAVGAQFQGITHPSHQLLMPGTQLGGIDLGGSAEMQKNIILGMQYVNALRAQGATLPGELAQQINLLNSASTLSLNQLNAQASAQANAQAMNQLKTLQIQQQQQQQMHHLQQKLKEEVMFNSR